MWQKVLNQYAVGELCDELKNLQLSQGPIYINKDGIGNLLLLGQLAKHYCITLDTNIENTSYVYTDNESYIKFKCKDDGLYCLDVDDGSGHTNLMTTVKDQKDLFSELDVKRATLARHIQECLCLLSDKDFSNGLETGGIEECGVDCRHIKLQTKYMAQANKPWKKRVFKELTRCLEIVQQSTCHEVFFKNMGM